MPTRPQHPALDPRRLAIRAASAIAWGLSDLHTRIRDDAERAASGLPTVAQDLAATGAR